MKATFSGVEILTRYKPGNIVWTIREDSSGVFLAKKHEIVKIVFMVHEKFVDWHYSDGREIIDEDVLYDEIDAKSIAREKTILESQRRMIEEADRRK